MKIIFKCFSKALHITIHPGTEVCAPGLRSCLGGRVGDHREGYALQCGIVALGGIQGLFKGLSKDFPRLAQ